ncbi:MAG: hypothetical protein C0469_03950 [Cyanobacteria bacterium DS2.3.42]|nr:hypothetical protein [Cyanobacteria bacterium DS2.3.42]
MTNDILDVLLKLAPLVNLLAKLEPISASDLPQEHHGDLKQLENLGIVYRRNSRNCALQKQRLIKIIRRETQFALPLKREACLSAFSPILNSEESKAQCDSSVQMRLAVNAT